MLTKQVLMVFFTCLLAICLSIMPLPSWAIWLRPAWVILVLAYWIITYPDYINVGFAWILGLLLDALYGSVLGEHALAMTVVAYLVYRAKRELKRYPLLHQGIFIIFCCFIYNIILYLLQRALGQDLPDWRFWISPFLGFLFWPVVFTLFRNTQLKYRIL